MIANGKKVQIDSRVYWPGCCADSPTPGASLYIAWVYWLAVVMVAVFGTMSADVTKSCRVFHIRNQLILCNCSRHYLRYPVLDILGKTLPPYCPLPVLSPYFYSHGCYQAVIPSFLQVQRWEKLFFTLPASKQAGTLHVGEPEK